MRRLPQGQTAGLLTACYKAAGFPNSLLLSCDTKAQHRPGPMASPPWDLGEGKPTHMLMLMLVIKSFVSDSGVLYTKSNEVDRGRSPS